MKQIKIHRLYDVDGNYVGPADGMLTIQGKKVKLEDYAKQHGITLPKKSKKQVNTDVKEKEDADMGQSQDQGYPEVD